LPKAASASRREASSAAGRSAACSITRMPRPPPPQLALSITGKPMPSARRWHIRPASSGSGGVAGITATPAATAAWRAATLLPSVRITSGFGPIQRNPAAITASAKSGFSDRKP
jgi:hypothetical protein